MSSKVRIFVVEDDEKLARTIQRRLELEGFDFVLKHISSRTINKDITEIEEMMNKTQFDLAILDYVFDPSPVMSTPDTSGLAVLKAIRKCDKFVPVLVFTGYPNEIDQTALVKEGASYVIIKGQENAMVEAVNKFIRERDEIVTDLEEIVEDNPKAENQILQGGTKRYSLKEVLCEIKKGSPEGRELYKIYQAGLSEILMSLKREKK